MRSLSGIVSHEHPGKATFAWRASWWPTAPRLAEPPVVLGDAKRSHEQRGRGLGLGLVISIEQDAWSTLTIIPTSTQAQASVFRPEVVVAGRATRILIDQIRTIDTSYVAGELVDYLSRDDLAQVEHSLSRYLGLLR